MSKIKKKLLLLVALLIIFSGATYAQLYEVDNVKQTLRKVLYTYLTSPESSPITLSEVKDLLVFYLNIGEGELTVAGSEIGSLSNRPISNIIDAGNNVADTIPACSDRTKYGTCSVSKPKYCYAGSLVDKCSYCGCPIGSECLPSDKCKAVTQSVLNVTQNITCSSDSDCGTSGFTGDYYCSNAIIVRDYLNYTCVNPGTNNSNCIFGSASIQIEYCDSALNKTCVNGSSTCQVINITQVNWTQCTPNWWCNVWSQCVNGIKTRTCTDANNCSTITGKPVETQSCGTANCSWVSDGICPSQCAAGADADCCKNAGKFVLLAHMSANLDPICAYQCYSSNYTVGATPCLPCDEYACYDGTIPCASISDYTKDGVCPNWCSANIDIDCCEKAGKCWIPGWGCYNSCDFGSGTCTESSDCSWTSDNCCPVKCSTGTDADCCTNSGRYVLTANILGACKKMCYPSNYTAGTTPCMTCSSTIDGACPNWCSIGSDADCCKNAGKC